MSMKKTIRTKTVELDGATFVIASLSFKQQRALHEEQVKRRAEVAEEAEKIKQADTPPAPKTDQELFDSPSFQLMLNFVICPSLNRALPDETPVEDQWTAERAEEELEFQTADLLLSEILAFSGLVKKDAVAVPLAETQESQSPTLVT